MTTHQQGMEPHRAQWRTQTGFLLAAIGSAVGLGNVWRFAYVSYLNGGGAFLIPYCIALLTAGIPIMILEFGIGHRMRGSAPMAIAMISPHWEWLGWWMVTFVMFGIALFYSVVIAWCFNYFVFAMNLTWGVDPNAFFFQSFLGLTAGPHEIGNVRTEILLSLLVVWLASWIIVFFGVQRGIEKANKIFMPTLLALTAILVVWTLMLPGAGIGLQKYLMPDFAKLTDPSVWGEAYTQIFFSLSIGFGIMITYASYLPRKSDLNVSAAIVCGADTFYAIFAGLAVFGALGYMSQHSALPFEQVVDKAFGLAFVAYPKAISMLPAFSEVFGLVFFFALAVAGLSSLISIIEAFSAAVMDKFHYRRRTVVSVLSILGFLGSVVFTTGGGFFWLDIVDHFLSEYGLFMACILECILIGWVTNPSRMREYVNSVSSWKIGCWWDWSVQWLIPAILLVLLGERFIADVQRPYGGYPWLAVILIGRDWLFITLVAALFTATRPWRRALRRE